MIEIIAVLCLLVGIPVMGLLNQQGQLREHRKGVFYRESAEIEREAMVDLLQKRERYLMVTGLPLPPSAQDGWTSTERFAFGIDENDAFIRQTDDILRKVAQP